MVENRGITCLLFWAILSIVILFQVRFTESITSSCQLESGECLYNVRLAPTCSSNNDGDQQRQTIAQLEADIKRLMEENAKQDKRLDQLEKSPNNGLKRIKELENKLTKSEKMVEMLQAGLLAKQTEVEHLSTMLQNTSRYLKECEAVNNRGYPQSCKQYLEWGLAEGNGYYRIKPNCSQESINVYCDMTSNGGGWTRLYYKNGARTCNHDVTWTKELIQCMGIASAEFGASASLISLSIEQSWLLLNGTKWSSTLSSGLENVFNCRTPTGTAWTDQYTDGYVFVSGQLHTNGKWQSMFYGCSNTVSTGQLTSVRMGGGLYHTGEFLHSSCNDYKPGYSNSITSKWSTNNIRSVWYR